MKKSTLIILCVVFAAIFVGLLVLGIVMKKNNDDTPEDTTPLEDDVNFVPTSLQQDGKVYVVSMNNDFYTVYSFNDDEKLNSIVYYQGYDSPEAAKDVAVTLQKSMMTGSLRQYQSVSSRGKYVVMISRLEENAARDTTLDVVKKLYEAGYNTRSGATDPAA